MIEHQTIEGRDATIAYMTKAFEPAKKEAAELVKVVFDNGETLFLVNQPMTKKTLTQATQALWDSYNRGPRTYAASVTLLEALTKLQTSMGLYKYSDDQERDDRGRWTAGGGTGVTSDSAEQHVGGGGQLKYQNSENPASDAFKDNYDPSVTPEQMVAKAGATELAAASDARMAAAMAEGDSRTRSGWTKEGGYTPERLALHEQIISRYLNAANIAACLPEGGERPTFIILGGRGGSGKTWLTAQAEGGPVGIGKIDPDTRLLGGKMLYLNNDDLKGDLPGYQGWNAGLFHEEASDLMEAIDSSARSLGMNVVLDATMKSASSASARLDSYASAGYRLEGYYMFAPPQQAALQTSMRLVSGTARLTQSQRDAGMTGRYVPAALTIKSLTNEATFDSVRGKFDKWALYQNTGKHGASGKILLAYGGK